jgi:hypothetical protein
LAWDANRPVPWRRLVREATIFIVIGVLVITILADKPKPGDYVGLLLGMMFYVAFVALLSKFGYERQSLRQARDRRRATVAQVTTASTPAAKPRPAPTKRTSTGPSQRPNRSTKKRRR